MSKRNLSLVIIIAFISFGLYAKEKAFEKKTLDPKTFLELKMLSDLKLSPAGKSGAYVVSSKNLDNNSSSKGVWVFSLYSGNPKVMTQTETSNFAPRWFPDGKALGFISSRSGSPQIWMMDTTGGEPRQLTDFSAGIDDFLVSPDGSHIAFTSTVYKECPDDKCVRDMDKKVSDGKTQAKVIEEPLFRHWDSWLSGKISRLFLLNTGTKEIKVVSPDGLCVPPIALGGIKDFDFSPDGREIAYTTNTDKDLSKSTNNDIYLYDTEKGRHTRITENKGNDNSPLFSTDGRFIAYLTQATPGFESDKINLAIYDRNEKKHTILTDKFDRWIDEFVWGKSGNIYFTAQDMGYKETYSISPIDKTIKKLSIKTYNKGLNVSPDEKYMVTFRESFDAPAEIFRKDLTTGKVAKLTDHNADSLKDIELGKWEEFTYKGAGGDDIQGFMVMPPYFNSKKKYPMVLLIHGGPQGSWDNSWHPRWNSQMFAAPGYITAAINFHGSIGFGQAFTNAISKDWTGKAFEDIMLGVDWLVKNQPAIRKDRICAAGGSFGGTMTNWLEAKTQRFSCLISHAGDSNHISAFGTTEEKWFPEWDVGGTPYDNFEAYKKMSPIMYTKDFKTPLLILHGEQDFRVPIEQALEMYTASRYAGIDVKMVLFPDEGHWIGKPRNAQLWWNSIWDWLSKYLKG